MKPKGIPSQLWFHYHPGNPDDPEHNPDVEQDSLWPEPFESKEEAEEAMKDSEKGWIVIGPYELKK